jgi:mono/diheme cytochrome c family protein
MRGRGSIAAFVTLAGTAILANCVSSARAQEPPRGKAPYDRVCSVCHGPNARGDAGPGLIPFEFDLDEVVGIVREGRGQMPPIAASRVSDEEIASIVEYLRSLDAPHSADRP